MDCLALIIVPGVRLHTVTSRCKPETKPSSLCHVAAAQWDSAGKCVYCHTGTVAMAISNLTPRNRGTEEDSVNVAQQHHHLLLTLWMLLLLAISDSSHPPMTPYLTPLSVGEVWRITKLGHCTSLLNGGQRCGNSRPQNSKCLQNSTRNSPSLPSVN